MLLIISALWGVTVLLATAQIRDIKTDIKDVEGRSTLNSEVNAHQDADIANFAHLVERIEEKLDQVLYKKLGYIPK